MQGVNWLRYTTFLVFGCQTALLLVRYFIWGGGGKQPIPQATPSSLPTLA